MSYDFYVEYPADSKQGVDSIAQHSMSVHARVQLLAQSLPIETEWQIDPRNPRRRQRGREYARDRHQALINEHRYDGGISEALRRMGDLAVPSPPDLATFPNYSFLLQFQFTLARPYISRDDEPFHIMGNPVRKDKVFKVPMASAASWKGNLRWTAMKTDLEPVRDDPQEFARRRLRHTLLFGTEKGFETSSDWERFLDHRCSTDEVHAKSCRDERCKRVQDVYRSLLRRQFGRSDDQALPHLTGWLHFCPTFFDKIGLEVINPHDRQTRAGRQPIFFECAPVGAKGTFSLLYVPLGHVDGDEARRDSTTVAKAVSEMMLTYGFSAKKTSGYGEAEEEIVEDTGFIWTKAREERWPLRNLRYLEREVRDVQWA